MFTEAARLPKGYGDEDLVHIAKAKVGSFYNPQTDKIVGYSKAPKNPNRFPKPKAGANAVMRIGDAKKKRFKIEDFREEVEQIDEALPPHLAKLFDKEGNFKDKRKQQVFNKMMGDGIGKEIAKDMGRIKYTVDADEKKKKVFVKVDRNDAVDAAKALKKHPAYASGAMKVVFKEEIESLIEMSEEFIVEFSPAQLDKMRKEYGKLKTINPTTPAYKKLKAFLDGLDKDKLMKLAGGKIDFVSDMAATTLRYKHKVPFSKSQPREGRVTNIDIEQSKRDLKQAKLKKQIANVNEMTEAQFDEYTDTLTEEQLDELIGTLVKGAGKLAMKGAKAGAKAIGNRLTDKGRAKIAQDKLAKMQRKRQEREKLDKVRDDIRKEKEAERKRREANPTAVDRAKKAIKDKSSDALDRAKQAVKDRIKAKIQKANDAEDRLKKEGSCNTITASKKKKLDEMTPAQRAKRDAQRAMGRGPKVDPADVDDASADKNDEKSAKKNIIVQLRKAGDTKGAVPVVFDDGRKQKVPTNIIQIALQKHDSFRKPATKQKLVKAMSKSYRDMLMALKTIKEDKSTLNVAKAVIEQLEKLDD